MVAFAETSRPTDRAYARQCVGSSSCAPGKNPSLGVDRNQQYSITALTDASGTITERYAYSAYGQPVFFDGSGTVISASAENNRYCYTGREWDEYLGLYHYRARMYDPVSGRFLSRDPIGFRMPNLGLYTFGLSGPLKRLDPYGFGPNDDGPVPGEKKGAISIDKHGFDEGEYPGCCSLGVTAKYYPTDADKAKCTSIAFKRKARTRIKRHLWFDSDNGWHDDEGSEGNEIWTPAIPGIPVVAPDFPGGGPDEGMQGPFSGYTGCPPIGGWTQMKQDFEVCVICTLADGSEQNLGCATYGNTCDISYSSPKPNIGQICPSPCIVKCKNLTYGFGKDKAPKPPQH